MNRLGFFFVIIQVNKFPEQFNNPCAGCTAAVFVYIVIHSTQAEAGVQRLHSITESFRIQIIHCPVRILNPLPLYKFILPQVHTAHPIPSPKDRRCRLQHFLAGLSHPHILILHTISPPSSRISYRARRGGGCCCHLCSCRRLPCTRVPRGRRTGTGSRRCAP